MNEVVAAPFAVRLADVVREIPGGVLDDAARGDIAITGVHHDSRKVAAGDLFVARSGAHADGTRFIADAVAKGARAVLMGDGVDVDARGAAIVRAPDVPRALAFASAAVYGHPTFSLDVVGVTGTNGKTTTSYLIRAAIDACGGKTGVIGTLGYRFGDLDLAATHTSPEADELARVTAAMLARGATHVAMEVSSIAIAARRVDAVRFRVAAFTNLTQDHLDYHGTMEAYAEAKAKLFFELEPNGAVINVDDAFGAELAKRLARAPKHVPLARYSAIVGGSADVAELAPIRLSHSREGIDLEARTPGKNVRIRSPLVGLHNVSNLLSALAVVHVLGLDVALAAEALSAPIAVPGRLERCDDPAKDDVVVLVDYAHTPDALARVLESVKDFTTGKIVCVFGCGGDRDPKKRPLMGEAVARAADRAIVTNDNPRSEDPAVIAEQILPGLEGGRAEFAVLLDRHEAIRKAVLEAKAGDVVLVAGKGHEPYQIVGDRTLAFDDRVEARRALDDRRAQQERR
jgi:UDP-N-acetylmuramoyl-L-alanyl-D-glutamate--2,6-diaminopimelate ligase